MEKQASVTQPLSEAFKHAGDGILHAFSERNMRIHACFAVLAIVLGIALRVDAPSWLAIVICIGLVFALEALNTSMECVVDLASPEYHDLARHAKDCAAGAVLIAAIASVVVACFVYIPPILRLIGVL